MKPRNVVRKCNDNDNDDDDDDDDDDNDDNDEYLDNLFQWNRIPRTYDARTSKIRKTFMSSVRLITERYKARMRFSLQNNITFI